MVHANIVGAILAFIITNDNMIKMMFIGVYESDINKGDDC